MQAKEANGYCGMVDLEKALILYQERMKEAQGRLDHAVDSRRAAIMTHDAAIAAGVEEIATLSVGYRAISAALAEQRERIRKQKEADDAEDAAELAKSEAPATVAA